ncbi:MAG: hypothetical protein HN975_16705 [Anaerolineae bacterium]|jgi:hypothetical protein|nr:hypothetical protein [Anaerolineae bacterium]
MFDDTGITKLAACVIQQAAVDCQAKNAQEAFEARAWLANEGRIYFDALDLPRSGLWSWMAAGCPKFRKKSLPRRRKHE